MISKFINRVNLEKKHYSKIYLFPFNVQSRYLHKKIKFKKSYIVDNYEPNTKIIVHTNKIDDASENLLIITDKKIEKYLPKKLSNIKIEYISLPIYFDKNKEKINLDKKKPENKSLTKLFQKYNTDKAKFYTRLSFKDKSHNYGPHYDKMFKSFKNKELNILEIGSFRGASTAAFHNYFSKSTIYALDIDKKIFQYKSKRIKFYKLDYMNKLDVEKFIKKHNNFFDIVIDDGGHFKSHILNNLKNFFSCLKSDSFYVIEDFGLKFNYLDDLPTEPSIYKFIKAIKSKITYKSRILNKSLQNKIINKVDFIKVFKGDWVRSGINVSDICFMKIK